MVQPADISRPTNLTARLPERRPKRRLTRRVSAGHGKERFEWLHQRKNGNVFSG